MLAVVGRSPRIYLATIPFVRPTAFGLLAAETLTFPAAPAADGTGVFDRPLSAGVFDMGADPIGALGMFVRGLAPVGAALGRPAIGAPTTGLGFEAAEMVVFFTP